MPDNLIQRLGKTLQIGSRLYRLDLPEASFEMDRRPPVDDYDTPPPSPLEPRFDPDFDKQARGEMHGTTVDVVELGRERFAYWSLELLFYICHDDGERACSSSGHRDGPKLTLARSQLLRRENASPPSALRPSSTVARLRCARTSLMRPYVARCPSRGMSTCVAHIRRSKTEQDLARSIRQEELVYLLQKLLSLRLRPNTLWASYQPNPSAAITAPTQLDTTLPLSGLVRSALLRSPLAHLCELHTLFTDLLALSNLSPSITAAYVPYSRLVGINPETGEGSFEGLPAGFTPSAAPRAKASEVEETDVVKLTLRCLSAVGKEIGAGELP